MDSLRIPMAAGIESCPFEYGLEEAVQRIPVLRMKEVEPVPEDRFVVFFDAQPLPRMHFAEPVFQLFQDFPINLWTRRVAHTGPQEGKIS